MAAIRDGIDANGEPLDPFMPRYEISDEMLDGLMVYLDTLSQNGVTGCDRRYNTLRHNRIILKQRRG